MPSSDACFRALVRGIVQGVGFRFFVFQNGVNLNLRGWVRNRINGRVEVLAQGPRDVLDTFIEKLKEGPQMAQVEQVDVEWLDLRGDLPHFTIRETE